MAEQPPGRPGPRVDSTRMSDQRTLQSSSGTAWLVVGAIFALLVLVHSGALIFVRPGESQAVAAVTAVLVLVGYGAIVAFRIVFPQGQRRLRWMAGALIFMAAVGVLGMLIAMFVENGAIRGA